MYATTQLTPDVWQITLAKPGIEHLPFATPNNVYLLLHETQPALINAGHPSQFRALKEALTSIGCPIETIRRLIITSWQTDCLAGSINFPQADIFVFSPDMIQPGKYNQWIEQERAMRIRFAQSLKDHAPFEYAFEMDELEKVLESYFPPMLGQLRFIPIRNELQLKAAGFTFTVHSAPGPDEGHIMLHDAERGWLFSGDIILDGLPTELSEVRLFLRGLQKADELEPQWVLPNHGKVVKRAKLRVKHARLFLENFIDNAPMAMHKDPTLLEFVWQDLGIVPKDVIRYVETLRIYRILLEELGRSRLLDTTGEGLSRRYGVGLNDPRAMLR